MLFFAQTLHAISFAAHHSVCIALISHYFPGRLRGRGQALYTVIGYGFPGVLGGVAGWLFKYPLGADAGVLGCMDHQHGGHRLCLQSMALAAFSGLKSVSQS